MHRASETIGKIALALAQAQQRLQNPAKELFATIASPFQREVIVSFRYASLAQGLDIIRKALGEQEIAAIQRTEIDKELGLIKLNTVLAHSSGEWITSDWPVCATSEITAPHRLGAALTYARRYALFALVGIAGEDDLDAPVVPGRPTPPQGGGGTDGVGSSAYPMRRRKLYSVPLSEETRRKLLTELERLEADDLTLWALRRLPLKNRLQDDDAHIVEAAYLARLESTAATAGCSQQGVDGLTQADDHHNGLSAAAHHQGHSSDPVANGSSAAGERGSALAATDSVGQLPKTLRRRNKAHLAFVTAQPCLVCQRAPSDAHHLKFAQPRALGRKVSDEFTVPLCRAHHRELHTFGNEQSWWANVGITPLSKAQELWLASSRIVVQGERPHGAGGSAHSSAGQ